MILPPGHLTVRPLLIILLLVSATGVRAGPHRAEAERLKAESPDAAIAMLSREVAGAPDDAETRHDYAEFLWAAGRRAEAEAEFRRVLEQKPDHLWARVGLAHLLLARGERGLAVESFLAAERHASGTDAVEIAAAALAAAEGALPDPAREALFRAAFERHGPAPELLSLYVAFMRESGRTGTLEADLTRFAELGASAPAAEALLSLAADLGRSEPPLVDKLFARYPENPRIARRAFALRLAAGGTTEAEAIAARLQERSPAVAASLLAELAAARGDTTAALLEARRAFSLSPGEESARLLLRAAARGGELPLAEVTEALRAVVSASRGEPAGLLALARDFLAAGRTDLAQRLANAAADLYPYGAAWPALQARLHLARGERQAAIETYERAVETESPSLDLYLELAALLSEEGRTAEVRLALARMQGHFPSFEDRLRILDRSIRAGAHDFAHACLQALRRGGDDYRLRKALYDLPPSALFAFLADPAAPRDDPFLLTLEAETRGAIGQQTEAIALLERTLALAPGDRHALLALGKLRMERAEFEAAERALAAAAAPGDAETDLLLGRARFLLGRYAAAREALERVARGHGLTAPLLLVLGRVHLALADAHALFETLASGARAGLRLPGPLLDRVTPAELERIAGEARGMADLDLAVVRFRLGQVKMRRGDAAAALAEFDAVDAALPSLSRTARLRSECLFALGRTAEAILAAEAALAAAVDLHAAEARDAALDTPYPCLTTLLAEAAISLGRYEEARAFLAAQVDGFLRGRTDLANDPDVMRGDVNFLPAFARRFALAGYPPQAAALAGDAGDKGVSAALAALAAGDTSEAALASAERALIGEAEAPPALYLRAYILQERGRTGEAMKMCARALAADRNLADAARLAGAILIARAAR